MKLKGKIDINKGDILMYKGIYDLANNKIQKIDVELIPIFIIEESLTYFCELEKYEFCQKIESFFKENPTFTTPYTREDWFGINSNKKQKY